MRFVKYLIILAAGFLTTEAYGQVLAPNAEVLLAKKKAGQKRVRANAKAASAVSADSVGAFIYVDHAGVLTELEQLGIKLRYDYGDYATATIPVDRLEAAGRTEGVKYISLGNDVNLLNDYAREHTKVDDVHINTDNQLPRPYTGKGIVVGIIDTGVEYGHLAFRNSDGTGLRIKAVWNQMSNSGTAPEKFGYGKELTTPEEILKDVYDTAGEFHGSHTMGIATGADQTNKYYGMAPEADIVFVSFKNDDSCIADGIQYIFDYADEVGKPCVVNMSLGQHTGPHNGTSILDRHIDSLTGPGRIIVGSCGNEGEYRLHATETFTETDTQLKTMLTFAEGVTHKYHYLDIWGTPGTDFKVQICAAQALKGNITYRCPKICDTADPGKTVIAAFYIDEAGVEGTVVMKSERNPLNGQPHVNVECTIEGIGTGYIPGIIIDGEAGQRIDMWNYSGHEFSSNGKKGWTNGTNSGTVGEIGGTAFSIITVGSYDSRDIIPWTSGGYSLWSEGPYAYDPDKRSVFSSCGPTVDGRTVPSVLAPGSPVISAINRHYFEGYGIDLYTNTSGASTNSDGVKSYYGYNVGTSMSAPVMTGVVALMLEAYPEITPDQIKEILAKTSFTNGYMGTLPNNEYGNGRLNALGCMKEAVALAGSSSISDVTSDASTPRAWKEGENLMIALPGDHEGCTATVYNVTGQAVADVVLDANITTLDCSSWAKGVYIVTVTGDKLRESVKVAI